MDPATCKHKIEWMARLVGIGNDAPGVLGAWLGMGAPTFGGGAGASQALSLASQG